MYTIYDSAAKAYTQPFFMHNDGLAIRAFQDNVNATEQNNISLHPDQFTLFKTAEWDDNSGHITPIEPTSLGNGLELKNPEQTDPKQLSLMQELEKLLEKNSCNQ